MKRIESIRRTNSLEGLQEEAENKANESKPKWMQEQEAALAIASRVSSPDIDFTRGSGGHGISYSNAPNKPRGAASSSTLAAAVGKEKTSSSATGNDDDASPIKRTNSSVKSKPKTSPKSTRPGSKDKNQEELALSPAPILQHPNGKNRMPTGITHAASVKSSKASDHLYAGKTLQKPSYTSTKAQKEVER